jgi:hypothetical protein
MHRSVVRLAICIDEATEKEFGVDAKSPLHSMSLSPLQEAKFLERLQDVNGVAEPVSIPSDSRLSGIASYV